MLYAIRAAISLLFLCFLMSDAKLLYLCLNGDGMAGFFTGLLNLTVIHIVFMGLYHFLFHGKLRQPDTVITGSLLSANAAYYAVIRQAILFEETWKGQTFLYWIPLLLMAAYLLVKNRKSIFGGQYAGWHFIIRYRFYIAAAVFLLLLPLIPVSRFLLYLLHADCLFLTLLFFAQWKTTHPDAHCNVRRALFRKASLLLEHLLRFTQAHS